MARKIVKQTKKELEKIEKQKQLRKEYKKHYTRVKKYVERYKEIGWIIPEEIIPPEVENITKKQLTKFSKIYIKDFRNKLKKLQSDEVGKYLTGKKAKEEGKRREKEWAEQHKKKPQEPPAEPDIPVFNVYEEIHARLLDFPSGKWVQGSNGKPMYYEFHTNTNILISILDDNMSIDGYEAYLLEKEESIVAEFDNIIYKESTQEQCDYSFVTLANELDYGRLYMDKNGTAEELSNMNDYYSLFE